jgi:hypothetical protein
MNTQIRGNTQIMAGTIQDAQIAAAAGIQTSKLADGALFIKSDGTVNMTAALRMSPATPTAPAGNTNFIQCVTDPVNAQDAATKAYVDSKAASGVVGGMSVRAASTANVASLSGTTTIDGIALSAGDFVLLKNQTTQSANGVYVIAAGPWTRHQNMDTWGEVPGMLISVQQGTANADTVWLSTADPGGTLGTTAITFVQVPGPSDILAGAGMTRTGQTIDVVAADTTLLINADNMQVRLDPARAITVVSAGIGVNTNNSLNFTGNKLNVDGGVVLWKTDLVIRETVGGTINGSNTAFTLANSPVAGSEMIFLNGVLLESGAGNDYTISGQNITMLTGSIPITGDRLKATYMKGASPVTPT